MRGNTRLFRVPSSSAGEGFHVWQGGIYFKTRRSEGNVDLREAIRDALRECKVYEDDLPFMTQTIEDHVLAALTLAPKPSDSLDAELDHIQEAVLRGEDVLEELTALADQIDEEIVSSRPGAVSFEQTEARQRRLRKVRYLREVAVRQEHRRKVRELQERLRQQVSPEAWKTYLLIEECANDELWRLQELAEGACV